MTITHTATDDVVELEERESSGVRVTLVWSRGTDRASVLVSDERSGATFALVVERDENPLDVFHHPFAYSTRRGSESSAARRATLGRDGRVHAH